MIHDNLELISVGTAFTKKLGFLIIEIQAALEGIFVTYYIKVYSLNISYPL